MTLVQKILQLYPSLTLDDFHPIKGSIQIQNDGDGEYIKEWNNSDYPQPSEKELA